jgi:hypothetical protein
MKISVTIPFFNMGQFFKVTGAVGLPVRMAEAIVVDLLIFS